MASALVAGGSLDALRAAYSSMEFAILNGLGNTQINAAGGTAAGLAAQVRALAVVGGSAPDGLERCAISFALAANCGVDFTSTTTTTNLRAAYTAMDPSLASGYTAGGLFS